MNRDVSSWRFLARIFLLGLWLTLLPLTASAEKVDWSEPGYDFGRIYRVLLADLDTGAAEFSSSLMARKAQDDYLRYAGKMNCQIVTGEQARRQISLILGVDLDGLFRSDPARAQVLYRENLPRVADVWVTGKVKRWQNDYYIVPERTVWEQRRVERGGYDSHGRWRNESYYITVPVTYPPHRVDVSKLTMAFEVYDARTGRMVLGREDIRDREDYNAQDGMFERICKSFFGDFGNKIHK